MTEAQTEELTELEDSLESEALTNEEKLTAESLVNNFANEVQEYSKATPDFIKAFNYLVEMRDKQLAQYSSLYPELSDASKRNQQIENEALEIITTAQQNGHNAAEFMYNLAKNLGYMQTNLMHSEEVRKSAKTLTSSSGSAAKSPMSIENLAKLSQEEFDEWYWQNKQEFKRIMGR